MVGGRSGRWRLERWHASALRSPLARLTSRRSLVATLIQRKELIVRVFRLAAPPARKGVARKTVEVGTASILPLHHHIIHSIGRVLLVVRVAAVEVELQLARQAVPGLARVAVELEYLRSYEGGGGAEVWVDGRFVGELDGLWDKPVRPLRLCCSLARPDLACAGRRRLPTTSQLLLRLALQQTCGAGTATGRAQTCFRWR